MEDATPQSYRKKADEVRAMAALMSEAKLRIKLLEIAQDYEALAGAVERVSRLIERRDEKAG